MAEPLTFYFDFSSPYGYLAAQRIDEIAARHGRNVVWKPYLLGVAFKETGGQPLLEIPVKGDYARHDIERSARQIGVPLVWPQAFPFSGVSASRAYYWLAERDEGAAKALARKLYRAAFGEGRDIAGPEAVATVAAELGHDKDDVRTALKDPAVKERLRREVDDAIQAGAFGSPYILVDGEPFWGHDRLDHIDKWLETGGW
ncbi:2-hydroxychromene-2-carboxylate isomerase [Ferruginivarius sediminum]|uniref:2-hydroxychromene-2-carboxylate isomerase n=1 Tax=Ferruginivarius sediminum TaxID=2661937 RepID=A0A369TBR9_9PROT|nr:2-hydroxychromene-2-carboxylate isomerase [Ferruginivarius sediminum]RDD62720.1 2-hydroxychromene-2-carboxylate isomerase [Ferruginivarius sediminum]